MPLSMQLSIFVCSLAMVGLSLSFMHLIARRRSDNRWFTLAFLLPWSAYCTFLSPIIPQEIRVIINTVLYFAIALVYCNSSIIRRLFAALFTLSIGILSELPASLFVSTLPIDPVRGQNLLLLYISWGTCAFQAICYFLIHRIAKLWEDKISGRIWLKIFIGVIPLFLCILSLIFNYYVEITAVPNWIHRYHRYINLLAAVMPFISIIIFLRLVHDLNHVNSEAESARYSELIALAELNRVRAQIEKNEAFRLVRHDMKNHLSAIDILGAKGNRERQHAYIARLLESPEFSADEVYCGNPLIDGLLALKTRDAKAAGIDITWSLCPLPEQLPFEDAKMCVLLGNLLDNAIKACAGSDEKQMSARISVKDSVFAVEIRNTCADPISAMAAIRNGGTAKRKGLGIQSVRTTLRSMNGDIVYSVSEDKTMIVCAFYLPMTI